MADKCEHRDLLGRQRLRTTQQAHGHLYTSGSREYHSCALAGSGDVTCWGDNTFGQTNVPSGVSFSNISAGVSHTCGGTGGELLCWGASSQGQMMYPTSGTFTKVSTFDDHSCALDDAGAIHCWGRDLFGYGTLSDAPLGNRYLDVSTGYGHKRHQ